MYYDYIINFTKSIINKLLVTSVFVVASHVIDGLSIWSPSQFVGTSLGSVTSFILAVPQGPNSTISIDFGDGNFISLVMNAIQSKLSSTHANI